MIHMERAELARQNGDQTSRSASSARRTASSPSSARPAMPSAWPACCRRSPGSSTPGGVSDGRLSARGGRSSRRAIPCARRTTARPPRRAVATARVAPSAGRRRARRRPAARRAAGRARARQRRLLIGDLAQDRDEVRRRRTSRRRRAAACVAPGRRHVGQAALAHLAHGVVEHLLLEVEDVELPVGPIPSATSSV